MASENEEVVRVLGRNVQLDEAMSPLSIINFVGRMKQQVLLDDAEASPEYQEDPYILSDRPKSILCIPMMATADRVKGICYLENRLIQGAFTPERLRLTNILAVQAAITIENLNLSRKNEELFNALTMKSSDSSKYNVDAPIKRVIDILIKIKTNQRDSDRSGNTAKDIDFIVQTLISNKLFSLDLDRIDDGKGNAIDEQTKQWINSQIMQNSHTITVSPPKENNNSGSGNGSASLNGSTNNNGLGLASGRSSIQTATLAKRLSVMSHGESNIPGANGTGGMSTSTYGGPFGRKASSLQKIASVGSDLNLEALESRLGDAFPSEIVNWGFSSIDLASRNGKG